MQLDDGAHINYGVLRDCIADPLLQLSARYPNDGKRRGKTRKKSIQRPPDTQIDSAANSDAEDLADFIDVKPLRHTRLPR